MQYAIVEKLNHNHIHAICDSKQSAERFLNETLSVYIQQSYFMDKSLTKEDFECIKYTTSKNKGEL